MEEDWGEGEETNMKLSKAFLIVFALHLVAVGGIVLFHFLEKRPALGANEPETVSADPASRRDAEGTPAVPVPPGSKIYFAKKGDTVESIATEHRVEETAILALNPKLLPGPDGVPVNHPVQLPDLEAGQEPRESPAESEEEGVAAPAARSGSSPEPAVPPKARPAEDPPPEGVAGGSARPAGQTHTVAKGENPYGIARRYGVTQEELMELNGITDPRKVQIGTVLKIPPKR